MRITLSRSFLPPARAAGRRTVMALLYPWYEVRICPAADARTSRCHDDGLHVALWIRWLAVVSVTVVV